MKYIDKQLLKCPTCGAPMHPAVTISGKQSKFWFECTSDICNTYIDTYIPLPHQERIHKDPHTFIGVFGGYGSGKTQCTIKDDEKHMLITPNGVTVVGSAVLSQVEQTWEKDWADDFPAVFVAHQNKQKKEYTLVNGHTVLIKSYYDEELLRSLNASRIHIVEASAVDNEIFVQLKTRLRNNSGTLPLLDPVTHAPIFDPKTETFKVAADWRRGLIESNPSSGWIRDQFLLRSKNIDTNGSEYKYQTIPDQIDNKYSSYVIPTKANKFLPPTFYEDNAKNKPIWWVNRFLRGSFDYAEGLVYPSIYSTFIDSFNVPANWVRLYAMDYGIRDETAFIFLAIDTMNEIVYAIDEIYVNNLNIHELSKKYYEKQENYTVNPYKLPVMDGRSINKRNDYNLRPIGDLFRDEGIFFEPAKMDLNARITRVNTLVESGKLKIFRDKCPNLYRELMDYKFPDRTADNTIKAGGDKPIDRNNHAVNALEFACMELPTDIKIMRLASRSVQYTQTSTKQNPYNPITIQRQIPKKKKIEDVFLGTGGCQDIWN